MKTHAFIILSLIIFSSCNTNRDKTSSEDSIVKKQPWNRKTSPLCFQRLEGTANQDTTYLKLIMDGDSVSGELNHFPFQKDSRRGTISGSRDGDLIKAVWNFMQEGMNDTISVEFKLEGDRLLQTDFSIDPKTGRQYTRDSSRFTIEYSRIDCKY